MDDRLLHPKMVTWTLHEDTILGMLHRCYTGGETPDEVYMEMYVNLIQGGDA
jgi:hypothetical protein